MYTLTEIWIYPIKSLAGISLEESQVEMRGLQYDRRWMLVNPDGRFMTQREIPEMALLQTALTDKELLVSHKTKNCGQVKIPLEEILEEKQGFTVEIWGDFCQGVEVSESISDWFSKVLGQKLRLVRLPSTSRRWADLRYAPEGQHVSFADGFPFLIIGQASLDALNARLKSPVPMNRFRPNFVFTGGSAHQEDGWSDFNIGNLAFRGVKPCARCIIPTTDQETGARSVEPLKTLASYRTLDKKILFGQNVIYLGDGEGKVRVGDMIVPK